MRTLKTSEAAAMLHVSANTLRDWEARFGYPMPPRTAGKHRLYPFAEIQALREALEAGLSPSSAISLVRDGTGADAQSLIIALSHFHTYDADATIERSLELRSVERTLTETLIPALSSILGKRGSTSAIWAYSMTWSMDWLRRARRLVSAQSREQTVLVCDACTTRLDLTGVYRLALELCCARSGIDAHSLPVDAQLDLSDALSMIGPDIVVLTGNDAEQNVTQRWVQRVRALVGPVRVVYYHRDASHDTSTTLLHESPVTAHGQLVELIGNSIAFGNRR